MNKEEAIEYLKNLIKNPTISQDPFCTTKIAIDTVLNYIEELEEDNIKWRANYVIALGEIDVIPKQKIRDKIEELKNVGTITTLVDKGKDVNNKEYFMQDEIDILKELLQEEK